MQSRVRRVGSFSVSQVRRVGVASLVEKQFTVSRVGELVVAVLQIARAGCYWCRGWTRADIVFTFWRVVC